ncbi:MAG: ATP-binding cassette domain-containing protein [Actinomycetota bacterium]|nr:ATP-binding cassette domain-containing protein [Actinomycetota bacterium]MDQ2955545.1 ATP-binding cassette domain-containing protein [Actinomycetota bacterium]
MPDVLEVRNLRKVYSVRGAAGRRRREFVAVDDISFSLPVGGALALVGESGSGKTTTGRMVVGLESPSSGEVIAAGQVRAPGRQPAAERRRRARQTQIVFQDPQSSLDRRQRIRDCLSEAVAVHFPLSRSDREDRVTELAELVGLPTRHLNSLPGALSGGERQRVAIARALAAEPQVVVLDEAVAALDVSIQAQILNLLADVRERTGLAYLFISHDLAVVRQVCDEALVLRDGVVVERGGIDGILEAPQHAYTRLLVASVPRPTFS